MYINFVNDITNSRYSDIDPLFYDNYNIISIVVQEMSSIQVREVINSLNNSSPGHAELPPFVAKACTDELIEPITHKLKLARVVPILKSGDLSFFTNYRPISVLSFLLKNFEEIIYILVFDFFE